MGTELGGLSSDSALRSEPTNPGLPKHRLSRNSRIGTRTKINMCYLVISVKMSLCHQTDTFGNRASRVPGMEREEMKQSMSRAPGRAVWKSSAPSRHSLLPAILRGHCYQTSNCERAGMRHNWGPDLFVVAVKTEKQAISIRLSSFGASLTGTGPASPSSIKTCREASKSLFCFKDGFFQDASSMG